MRFLVIVLVLLVTSVAEAQEKRAMYPYSVFNEKPLTVGTNVWVNLGDTECTYGRWSGREEDFSRYAFPSTSDRCFREYHKARIVQIVHKYKRFWYKVEIEGRSFGDYRSVYAEFDRLYEIFNTPEEVRKHSKYFLALNW